MKNGSAHRRAYNIAYGSNVRNVAKAIVKWSPRRRHNSKSRSIGAITTCSRARRPVFRECDGESASKKRRDLFAKDLKRKTRRRNSEALLRHENESSFSRLSLNNVIAREHKTDIRKLGCRLRRNSIYRTRSITRIQYIIIGLPSGVVNQSRVLCRQLFARIVRVIRTALNNRRIARFECLLRLPGGFSATRITARWLLVYPTFAHRGFCGIRLSVWRARCTATQSPPFKYKILLR